uniref:Uncharacterized protein n=1 Tax=Caenorhabditis japonica TaxID=281687 RepID=A0A8R1HYK0_CAEJA
MLAPLLFVFFAGLASVARAQIGKDLNCTKNDGTDDVYTDRALICSNTQKDAVCEVLYPKNPDYPTDFLNSGRGIRKSWGAVAT